MALPAERILHSIHLFRKERVLLDADLATLYGVETRVLIQAVKRNSQRFPVDFMLQLDEDEWADLKSQSVISSSWGGRRTAPYAFTELGVAMLSSVVRVPNKTPTGPRENQAGCTARKGPQGDVVHRSRALTPRGARLAFSLRARAGGRRDAASRSSRVVPATRLLAFLASLARRPSRSPVGGSLGTLNSERAIQVNISIMRAFTLLRTMLTTHADLARKLEALERKYDGQFRVVFEAIRDLMEPPLPAKKPIGFRPKK